MSLEEDITRILPEFSEERKRCLSQILETCKSWDEFENHQVCENMTLKELKMLKPIIEDYFEKKKLCVGDCETMVISGLIEAVGCTEKTARWIYDNASAFPTIEILFDQPELEDLTNKQVKLLRQNFDKLFGKNSASHVSAASLELQISSELNLGFQFCQQIVKMWREKENLDEIFGNELCDDITLKQQKAIAAILNEQNSRFSEREASETSFRDDHFHDFCSFLELIGCKLHEDEMSKIWKSVEKGDIRVFLETVENKAISTLQQFQISVKYLKKYSGDELLETTITRSTEFTSLRKKIDRLCTTLQVDDEAKLWMAQNILDLSSAEDFENCDFLTVKQLKVFRKELQVELLGLIDVRQRLRDSLDVLQNSKLVEVSDKEKREQQISLVDLCSSSEEIRNDSSESSERMGSSSETFNAEPLRMPDLKSMKSSKVEMKETEESCPSMNNLNWPESKAKVAEMIAEIFPLITCADQMQGDRVVEQFVLRAEHIKRLCNLNDGSENFYYDISSGLNINFTELNKYELDLVGVLGRLDIAKRFFSEVLSAGSLKMLVGTVTRDGSGIYMIAPQSLYSFPQCKAFLYFYSDKDQDYHESNQKSRAIHFIRYMTQLTKNVVTILDKSDMKMLSMKPANHQKKKARTQKYNVCELELQKEDTKLEDIGTLRLPRTHHDSTVHLHGSNSGFYLVSSRFQSPTSFQIDKEKSIMTRDFEDHFNLKNLHEHAEICDEFKQKYLEVYKKEIHQEIEKDAANLKAAFLDGAEDSDLYKIIDFAVIQKVLKSCFSNAFALIDKYFELNGADEKAEKWKSASKLDFEMRRAISQTHESRMVDTLRDSIKSVSNKGLSKIVLRKILHDGGREPSESKGVDALYSEAWDNKLIGNKSWMNFGSKPNVSEPSIQKSLVETLEKILQSGDDLVLEVRSSIDERFAILEQLTSQEVAKNRETQTSQYASFKKEMFVKMIQPEVEEVKRKQVNEKFNEILEGVRTHDDNDETQNLPTNVIKSITAASNYHVMRFNIVFTRTEVEDSKNVLEIFKLTLNNRARQNLQEQSDMTLKTDMLNLTKVCRIEPPQLESPNVFPIDSGLALLAANCGKQSRVMVYSTSKGQQHFKSNFGKKISLSDFDTINRILCLYSEHGEAKELNLYQFDNEYKNLTNYSCIDLSGRFNFQGVASLKLQYGSKFVWVLESTGNRVLKLNVKNGTVSNSSKLNSLVCEVGNFTDLHMTHNGQCVFLSSDGGSRSVMTQTFNVLEETLPSFKGKTVFKLPETDLSLIANFDNNEISFQKLTIRGAEQELKLQEADFSSVNEPGSSKLKSKNARHWIHNLFWVFTKFPCEEIFSRNESKLFLTAVCSDVADVALMSKLLNEIHHEIKTSLKMTFKPTTMMADKIHIMHSSDYSRVQRNETSYFSEVGAFLQKLICFTPMQIARCQANEFLVLQDGIALSTESARDVFEMKENIDLGLFEAIFNWWPGNVKVISSMGKQTTGKSYMLNHVMGTSFNISGARCTDGCWMTLNVQDDCLYVILDFEGLGSFERTDQDDMLLSLFNSAVSTMTLFKTEHRIDRDTDQLFSKFNLGSDQLKGTGGIFNGCFVIVIKDVAEADLQDIGKEFIEKINNILIKEKQNNFISKLYKGGFQINPFPPFQTDAFFEEMSNLREEVVSAKAQFVGGPMFRDTMKLLLAKLAINDFTPLGKQQIDARIKFIKNHLETALSDGVLILHNDGSDQSGSNGLTLLDKQNEAVPEQWKLSLSELEVEDIKLMDTKFHFTEDGFIGLVNEFSQYVTQTSSNFLQWRNSLETFVKSCLENRFGRVESWVIGNVVAWQNQDNQEFDDAICSLLDKFNLEKTQLLQKIQLCNATCSKCFLKCTQLLNHTSAHSCTTAHVCTENCFYCEEELATPCKHPFGHENQHVCSQFSHICGQQCSFNPINECPNECVLLSNHEGDHACSLKKHLCKKPCSVDICSGECQLDCSVPHETHKCAKEQCVHECCVENCKNKCTARNHFHGNNALIEQFNLENGIEVEGAPFLYDGEELHIEDHFCGAEHFCGKDCEEDGYCEVIVEKTISKEEIFQGKRSTFSYKKQFVQIGKKLPCLRKVLPFEKDHVPSEHYCTLTMKNHICTEICPTCENICDKPHGHWETEGDEKHHTSHGNMTKCYFICNREDFDVGEHKYKVGEQSVAEFCHLFCNSLGRGHIHVVECPGDCEDEFTMELDHRRHETCKYGPNEEVPKDEIQHAAYWELIGFEDPCTGENAETFEKCPFYCSAISHEEEKTSEGDDKRYHCELELWHKPTVKLSDTGLTNGTVSKDGHVFSCHHEALSFHWVFALDKSSSMGGGAWESLRNSVLSFMTARKSLAPGDRYSILLYDHGTYLVEEYVQVGAFNGSKLSQYSASGFTDFAKPISECDSIISRHLSKTVSPVFIFMSDGGCHNGEKEMAEMSRKYKVDFKLKVFTIGFGCVDFSKLKELARVGGGQYMECATGIKLESSFLEIASSMPPTVSVTSSK